MLEKGLIVNSLFGDIPSATNQTEGRKEDPADFLVHKYKSKLNNLERALKRNRRFHLGFKYDETSVQVTRVLVVIV